MKNFLLMGILLLVIPLTLCCPNNIPEQNTISGNSQHLPVLELWSKTIPHLKKPYTATVAIIESNFMRSKTIGAGTIINYTKGQPIQILTSHHVIKDIKQGDCVVATYFWRKRVDVVAKDAVVDLALLETVELAKQTDIAISLSPHEPPLGAQVWTIGSPEGEARTVSHGIISRKTFYQNKLVYNTDLPIYFGNSGGGVFDSNGEIVGVVWAVRLIPGYLFETNIPIAGSGMIISREEIKHFLSRVPHVKSINQHKRR